jgi:hypothetical protein
MSFSVAAQDRPAWPGGAENAAFRAVNQPLSDGRRAAIVPTGLLEEVGDDRTVHKDAAGPRSCSACNPCKRPLS